MGHFDRPRRIAARANLAIYAWSEVDRAETAYSSARSTTTSEPPRSARERTIRKSSHASFPAPHPPRVKRETLLERPSQRAAEEPVEATHSCRRSPPVLTLGLLTGCAEAAEPTVDTAASSTADPTPVQDALAAPTDERSPDPTTQPRRRQHREPTAEPEKTKAKRAASNCGNRLGDVGRTHGQGAGAEDRL
jgi:hypothetical protein